MISYVRSRYLQSEKHRSSIKLRKRLSAEGLHRTKSLQWKVVYLVGLQEGNHSDYRSTETDLIEERRLCFVVISRAEEKLIVTRCRITGDRARQPSRLLAEMGLQTRGRQRQWRSTELLFSTLPSRRPSAATPAQCPRPCPRQLRMKSGTVRHVISLHWAEEHG